MTARTWERVNVMASDFAGFLPACFHRPCIKLLRGSCNLIFTKPPLQINWLPGQTLQNKGNV
jgi:hypothetical protein